MLGVASMCDAERDRPKEPPDAGRPWGASDAVSDVRRPCGGQTRLPLWDTAIRDRDDMLATWVADRDYALKRECKALRDALPPLPEVDVAPEDESRSTTRDMMERLRRPDKLRKLDLAIVDARGLALTSTATRNAAHGSTWRHPGAEGWPHAVWRKLRRQLVPPLTTSDKAAPRPAVLEGAVAPVRV